MAIVNVNKQGVLRETKAAPETERTTAAEKGFDRGETIKNLREKELLLNYVINKGLVNEEVERIKSELSALIKDLEALNG